MVRLSARMQPCKSCDFYLAKMAIDGTETVFDARFYNIVVLGISFMLIFTAFQTASMAEVNILELIVP